jgi:hypothetical protein
VTKINWKSDDKNLTKLYPMQTDDEDEIGDPGSFFNFFEHEADPSDVSDSGCAFPVMLRKNAGWSGNSPRYFP